MRPTVVMPGGPVLLHVKVISNSSFLSRAVAIEHGREITPANFRASTLPVAHRRRHSSGRLRLDAVVDVRSRTKDLWRKSAVAMGDRQANALGRFNPAT
jgi:hypothetical protein